MQVRTSHPSRRSDESDSLPPHYRVARGYERLAQVEVSCDDTTAVIDVNNVTGEKEIVDESNDTTVCRAHRLTGGAPEVDTEVTAGHATVEETSGSELARDDRCPGPKEGCSPHWRRVVRVLADVSRASVLAFDARRGCGIERASEGAVDSERLRYWWWTRRQRQPRANRLALAGHSLEDDAGDETASGIDWNRADRMPGSGRGIHEVQRLTGQCAADRNDRVSA